MLDISERTGADTKAMRELDRAWDRFRSEGCKGSINLRGSKITGNLTRRRKFKSAAVERRFREKEKRVMTAIALGAPDRVPVITNGMTFYPAFYSGVSSADFLMDRKKCREAFLKFSRENTDFDMIFPAFMNNYGKLVALSQLDILKLPGVDLQDDVSFQFVEKERLKPEEYPQFLREKYDFFRRVIMPRMTPLYHPRKGWDKKVLLKMTGELLSFGLFYNRMLNVVEYKYGVPVYTAAMTFEPYDLTTLLFRGLTGISGDLFRRPEMVEEVTEMLVPVCIMALENMALATGLRGGVILCERSFSLSPKQFARFSMPTLKKVVSAVIERGMVPLITLEGDCTHLFEFMLEFPPGKCVCNVDTGDIFKAKRILEGHMCVAGNVPMNLMVAGNPYDIREYCRRLIEEVAPGGGFILSGALGIPDNARYENVRAMVDYVLENGEYR
ncbi:MAG: uroporphyrinogen decarboxylase family protein [Actinomycetota bacterium]